MANCWLRSIRVSSCTVEDRMTGNFVHKLYKNFIEDLKFVAKEMGVVKLPLIEEMDLRGMDGANMRSKDTVTSF